MRKHALIEVAVMIVLLPGARVAMGEPLADAVREQIAPRLPSELGVAQIHLEPSLAALAVEPGEISVEVPRALRPGRTSMKLAVHGHHPRTAWVTVSLARRIQVAVAQRAIAAGDTIADADVATEPRALDGVTPAPVDAVVGAVADRDVAAGEVLARGDVTLPAPLARGTEVAIDIRRGGVHIRGTGVLEIAARPGDVATARIELTHALVHGTLVAPATLVIGDAP